MAKVLIKKPLLNKYQKVLCRTVYRSQKQCKFFSTVTDGNEDQMCKIQEKPGNITHEVRVPCLSGPDLVLNCGKLAKFADGCVTVTLDNTTVMATAVSKIKSNDTSFVPLTVSYHQKAAALGRIPLNFLRRDLGQNENEILTSRLIDRSIRPLFAPGFNWETQIVCTPLAIDGSNFPDVLAINAASAALSVSDIPWNGPVGAVRVGLIDGNIFINPCKRDLSKSEINLIVAAKNKKFVVMLEGSFSSVLLQNFLKALKAGMKECHKIVTAIEDLMTKCGKVKRVFEPKTFDENLYEIVKSESYTPLLQIFRNFEHDKVSRDLAIAELQKKVVDTVQKNLFDCNDGNLIFQKVCKDVFRELILTTDTRCDGRNLNMLRNINCEVDLYEPLHGSALFQRGQTQVLCTVALDSPNSALKMDRISMLTSGIKEKNFFVHYEFPPYATKEVGRIGPVGRREIGHGALAEKALKGVIPENFPFTIRLSSEVLESNGSSSMATVCGGSLALMDAGVPLKNACAGVAMGVITKFSDTDPSEVENYKILTDLLGIEDYFGDMDFKIAGTKTALTALQLDMKTQGLPVKIITESIVLAKSAISTIINRMNSVCREPRTVEKSKYPLVENVTVPMQNRSKFLGIGGIHLKKLEMKTGVEISEESPGDFRIFAPNKQAMNEATQIIKEMLMNDKEPVLEFGGVYTATVVEIKEHGCMVILYPNMQPVLLHITQLDQRKVSHPSALGITVGHEIQVKYFGRDPVSGSMRLSRKVLQATKSPIAKTFFKNTEDAEIKKDAAEV